MNKLFIRVFFMLSVLLAGYSCKAQNNHLEINGKLKMSSICPASPKCDTLYADFKLLKEGRKVFRNKLLDNPDSILVVEKQYGSQGKYCPKVISIEDLREGNGKHMSDNLSILMLIDRSGTITDAMLEKQGAVVKSFLEELQGPRLYISFMENGTVTPSVPIKNKDDYRRWVMKEFYTGDSRQGGGGKQLYRAILSKLQELSGETSDDISGRNPFPDDGERMLFVFTDGKVKDSVSGEPFGGYDEFLNSWNQYVEWRKKIEGSASCNIPVHCVYVGDIDYADSNVIDDLKYICAVGSKEDERGHFYHTITPDSLYELMMGTLDSLSSDYRLVMLNPEGKLYDGTPFTLALYVVENGDTLFSGEREYAYGNKQSPVRVSYNDSGVAVLLLKGLLCGILLLAFCYFLLQFLVPKLRYMRFLKKYVKPFSATAFGSVSQTCYYCKEPFSDGDMVVAKCQHIVHKECWEENRNRCPEYGVHKCSKGIHYYNSVKKTDPLNATRYLPWIISGLLAGLLAWMSYTVTQPAAWFSGMVRSLTLKLYPFASGVAGTDDAMGIASTMAQRTSNLLTCGIFLGFFIVLCFCWVLEYRKKDTKVVFAHLLRSLVGAMGGFLSFLLGIVILIVCGKHNNCAYLDWIPWLLFSLVTAMVLWFKTEIKLSSALLGGAASVIFCFIIMYVFTGSVTSLFSYMIYAAGFGMSVAVVHFTSEKYFLRIDGSVKERDIAIYKWMSVTGGFNKVSIGKSTDCVLQMNWDDSPEIGEKVVELYLENERPYCRILDNGVTRQGRSLPRGFVIPLVNGAEFTIGKTRFTYVEKDR